MIGIDADMTYCNYYSEKKLLIIDMGNGVVGGLHLGSRASCWDGSLGAFVQSKGGRTCFKYARALTASSIEFHVAFHQLHFSFPMIEAPVPLRDVCEPL